MQIDPNTLFMAVVATAIYVAVNWQRNKKRPGLVAVIVFGLSTLIAIVIVQAVI